MGHNVENVQNRTRRVQARLVFNKAAFQYDPTMKYNEHKSILIGKMDEVCAHCNSLKFKIETNNICCSNGKVKLPTLLPPPKPLLTYLSGTTEDSKHFLENIRRYNSCFQMTSFGATKIANEAGFMPTFKVQGQIYHLAGSLLPLPDSDAKFMQIYFMGDENAELNQRQN